MKGGKVKMQEQKKSETAGKFKMAEIPETAGKFKMAEKPETAGKFKMAEKPETAAGSEELPEELLWFWLQTINGLGPASLFPMLMYFGKKAKSASLDCSADEAENKKPSEPDFFYDENENYVFSIDLNMCIPGARRLFYAAEEEIISAGILKGKKLEAFLRSRNPRKIKAAFEKTRREGVRFVSYADEQYPDELRHLYDPPLGIFVKGNLPAGNEWSVAIVGARACSTYGSNMAKKISRGLAFSGISIVSGMARGIDSAAHWGCIEGGGRTYAVLGCGVDKCYPEDNLELYEQILESGGGIISEYPIGSKALSWHFPMRNRLIAALSKGITVIEARKKSGSLITAQRGLELGRDIFAVPGRAEDSLSEGSNELIRSGAMLVTSPSDILSNFGIMAREYNKINIKAGSRERKIYSKLSLLPTSADEICRMTGMDIREVSAGLSMLEINGYIASTGKNQYLIRV